MFFLFLFFWCWLSIHVDGQEFTLVVIRLVFLTCSACGVYMHIRINWYVHITGTRMCISIFIYSILYLTILPFSKMVVTKRQTVMIAHHVDLQIYTHEKFLSTPILKPKKERNRIE